MENIESDVTSPVPAKPRVGFRLLITVLVVLVGLYAASDFLRSPADQESMSTARDNGPSWLTEQAFLNYVDGATIPLPVSRAGVGSAEMPFKVTKGKIEKLRIDAAGGFAIVNFEIAAGDLGRFQTNGNMVMHSSDGREYLGNYGQWIVEKKPD